MKLLNFKYKSHSVQFSVGLCCQIRRSVVQNYSYMSNTDNLYPIDKSTLPTVRFDPDSCHLPSDDILRMAKCLAMQEVRNAIYTALLSRLFPSQSGPAVCITSQIVRSIGSIGQSCLRSDNFFTDDNALRTYTTIKNKNIALFFEKSLKTRTNNKKHKKHNYLLRSRSLING